MKFQGSIIKEQGVTFAIVIVKKHIIDNKIEAARCVASFQQTAFPGIPVVLMSQDHHGIPSYYGREDIAKFMANVPLEAVPWKEYTLNV